LPSELLVVIPMSPGGVRFIGPRGSDSGIGFQAQPSPNVNLAPVGKHRVTVSYTNKADGKQFDLENVWTGTVAANEVVFTVK
jgi:hypothetical protein